jgi:REP element-mobilizing transposase RayT
MKSNFRADTPGTFHHVISRSVDGMRIFSKIWAKNYFIYRLEKLVKEKHLKIHAWVLMSNHFHLLVEPMNSNLSSSMQKLLTGFAMYYNTKSDRKGHLFQSRFRSILIEKETYLLELVRYIHLNPLKAGIVKDLNELNHYYPSGHAHITGVCNYPWQDTDLVKSEFIGGRKSWVSNYMNFLKDGVSIENANMDCGLYYINRDGLKSIEDEKEMTHKRSVRITGSKEFSKKIYKELYDTRKLKIRNRSEEHTDIENVIHAASEQSKIPINILRKSGGPRRATWVRRIIVKILMQEYGVSQADTARYMRLSETAVCNFNNDVLDATSLNLKIAIKQSIKV